ncbi:MAG: UDP-3-O-(3-hydroxymyristoyl)glucosamine N-acyltransferase [Pseudomonadales bacterium]|nr:UDP-3-O-(3-hydroxymyristoyl)glucosamine N-acyltransferase [Pseudomonadales bacterium]
MGYKLTKEVNSEWVANSLNLPIGKLVDMVIDNVAPANKAGNRSLSFITSSKMEVSENVMYIGPTDLNLPNVLASENPRFDFIRILRNIFVEIGFDLYNFDADIHPTVTLGQNVVIERGVRIGAGTHLDHNVVVKAGTIVGMNCFVGASTTIGSDGFGYERGLNKVPIKFVHLGGVRIEDEVEIGSLNSVVRGTLGDTILGKQVKTDNLVHIAHNCNVGEGTLITACAELSGGVEIGKNAWIAPNTSVKQKIVIGEEALIGIGAVVTRDVESSAVVAGNPAKVLNKAK